ncbi:MAG: glycosyltransferase family 2 protein [Hormoscilla sp. GM7CHS1pb]|nr:glycosyltransferase family 2 protein [Hormoscilla sp. GM7CHS1pb]MBC6479972.1 glycosyltransferase family 2 protein [Hormoscilla sp. GM7CHS1pb]
MKITCSILCYNYGRYLNQAIESCLNQAPGDYELEVLVIDDGSTDETPEVCQRYQDSIRVLRSENQGFAASLTKAIREASGDYVCLLDADDYFAQKKLVTILPYVQKGYLYIKNRKYIIDREGKVAEGKLARGGSTSSQCLNRAAALTLLPADNDLFSHPLNSAGHGIELSEPLTYYRMHDASITDRQVPGDQHHYLARVTHALADRLLVMARESACSWATTSMLKKISKEYRAIAYYDEMEAALELKQRGKALKACLGILMAAVGCQTGLTVWHLKVIVRWILGKQIRKYPEEVLGRGKQRPTGKR